MAALRARVGELSGYHGLEQRLWLIVVHVWVMLLAAALIAEARIKRLNGPVHACDGDRQRA